MNRYHAHPAWVDDFVDDDPHPEPSTLAEWAVAIAGGIAAFVAFWVAVTVALLVLGR